MADDSFLSERTRPVPDGIWRDRPEAVDDEGADETAVYLTGYDTSHDVADRTPQVPAAAPPGPESAGPESAGPESTGPESAGSVVPGAATTAGVPTSFGPATTFRSGGVPGLGGAGLLIRRHRRQSITFAVALAVVLVVGAGAFAVFKGTLAWPFGGSPPATSTPCSSPTPSIQAAALTRVRVFNASARRGLALAVSRDLQKRGFKVPSFGNDPMESKPASAAVVRYGTAGNTAAHTVGTQVVGKVIYQRDDRVGEVVDLVLGQSFALVDAAKGASALKVTAGGIVPGCVTSS